MSVYFDIHTHLRDSSPSQSVLNLMSEEAEAILATKTSRWYSVGWHPWQAVSDFDVVIEKMRRILSDPRVVFVGECGLDKNSTVSFELQQAVFKAQIAISEELNKPVILHCVGYFNELLLLKRELRPVQPWIIHGFRGKPQLAVQLLREGCALSFGEYFNPESVNVTPIERLFVETDESQLSINAIYEKVAAAKDVPVSDLSAGKELFSVLCVF